MHYLLSSLKRSGLQHCLHFCSSFPLGCLLESGITWLVRCNDYSARQCLIQLIIERSGNMIRSFGDRSAKPHGSGCRSLWGWCISGLFNFLSWFIIRDARSLGILSPLPLLILQPARLVTLLRRSRSVPDDLAVDALLFSFKLIHEQMAAQSEQSGVRNRNSLPVVQLRIFVA